LSATSASNVTPPPASSISDVTGLPNRAWGLPLGVRLMRRTWGEEAVIYNEASGRTHLLDAFSDWLLQQLEAGPVAVEALVDRAVAETAADRGSIEAHVVNAIESFERLGLADIQMRHR